MNAGRMASIRDRPRNQPRRSASLRVTRQLVLCRDDGQEETSTDIVTVPKASQRLEPLGLTLREANPLLKTLQPRLRQHQVQAFLDAGSPGPDGGTPLQANGYQTRTFRTVCGPFKRSSPRLYPCGCQRRKPATFRPLTSLRPESVAPELRLMETKAAALVSSGWTVDARTDFLPLEVTLDVKTVRHDPLQVAQRCEAELGEEHGRLIDGGPRDGGSLPISAGPITVGLDGG